MNIVTTKDLINNIRICKYCGMELSEGIPHGLRECHLRAVARIAELREDNASLGDSNAWIKQNYEDLERDYGVMHEKMCARIDNLTAENKVLEDACEILRKENRRLFSQVFLNAYGKEREEIDIQKDQLREAKNILIDKNLQIDSLYEEGYKLQKRIAELEAESERVFDLVRKLRMYCIYANWDNPDTEDDFNEFDVEVCKWLSKYMEREE